MIQKIVLKFLMFSSLASLIPVQAAAFSIPHKARSLARNFSSRAKKKIQQRLKKKIYIPIEAVHATPKSFFILAKGRCFPVPAVHIDEDGVYIPVYDECGTEDIVGYTGPCNLCGSSTFHGICLDTECGR